MPMSSGKPARPIAVVDATNSLSSALSRTAPPPKSVSMAPGAIEFTRIRDCVARLLPHGLHEAGLGGDYDVFIAPLKMAQRFLLDLRLMVLYWKGPVRHKYCMTWMVEFLVKFRQLLVG